MLDKKGLLGSVAASALALGRVTVRSALGESLRAEIDLPEVTAEELSGLRTAIATPEATASSRSLWYSHGGMVRPFDGHENTTT